MREKGLEGPTIATRSRSFLRLRLLSLVLVGVLLVGAGVVVMTTKSSLDSWAVLVLTTDGDTVELMVPYPVANALDSHFEIINEKTRAWHAELLARFPVSNGTRSSAVVVRQNGTWLRVTTDGTLLVGLRWTPRAPNDVFAFGAPSMTPPSLNVVVTGVGRNASLGLLSFSEEAYFLSDRSEVRYTVTCRGGLVPTGSFSDVHPGLVLGGHVSLHPIEMQTGMPLCWGTFSFTRWE